MSKEYYNKKLNKVLNKYINFGKYGIASIILKDIFQRREYEFGFSIEHMKEEVQNFSKNCTSVKFLSGKEFQRNSLSGIYEISKKSIKINLDQTVLSILREKDTKNNTKHANQELYSTLAHEVLHAILKRNDIATGLMYLDEEYSEKGNALNEIFTEQAANRISKNLNPKTSLVSQSYSEITPLVNLLAAACGIPEKKILKAGTQSREELKRVILQKFPIKEHDKLKDILGKFEISLDIIYNIQYIQRKENLEKDVCSDAYSQIEEIAYTLASSQMSNDSNLTPEQKAIRLKRIEQIGSYINNSFMEFDTTDIAKKKQEEILLMPGVKEALQEIDASFDKEYTSDNKWDSSAVHKYIDLIFNIKMLKDIPNKIKDKISTFIGSNEKKMLNSGDKAEKSDAKDNSSNVRSYIATDFDKRYKVNEEDLISIEEKLNNNGENVYTKPEKSGQDNSGEAR